MSTRSWLRVAAVTVGVLGFVHGTEVFASTDPDQTIRPARERLVEAWLIGGSHHDPARRMVGTHQIGAGGWPDFVNQRARDVYDWGLRRFWLHNPFGTLPAQLMQFDQYLDAEDAGLDVLTENFSESWAPVVQGSFGEPVELIAYLGTADSADDRLKTAFADGNPASILGTMLACVKPVLLAGGSIGADMAVKLSDDGPEFHFYKYLESIGIPVYVESRPKLDNPGWAEFPVFAVDAWWKRSDPAHNPDCVPWALPNEAMQAGVVRWMRNYPGASTDPAVIAELVGRIREALLEGHTVLFRSDGLRAAGVTLDQLVAGIDEQLGVESGSSGSASNEEAGSPFDDPMDMIEAEAERVSNDYPDLPMDSTPAESSSAPGGSRSSGGSGGGGSSGGSGGGSASGASGSIEIKPRGSSGGVTSSSGKTASMQRVGTDTRPISDVVGVTPNRVLSVVVRRNDRNGRSVILHASTGKPADWVERARRSARRVSIANGGD